MAKPRKTKAMKEHEERIHRLMGQAISGIPINIMDLAKVHNATILEYVRCTDEEVVVAKVREFALSISPPELRR